MESSIFYLVGGNQEVKGTKVRVYMIFHIKKLSINSALQVL